MTYILVHFYFSFILRNIFITKIVFMRICKTLAVFNDFITVQLLFGAIRSIFPKHYLKLYCINCTYPLSLDLCRYNFSVFSPTL